MKLAVVGKGGSGKTTTSAVVARTLGRRGVPVVALDSDTNPNLGISLGLGDEDTEHLIAMRQALDEGGESHATGWDELLQRFGTEAPDGVRLAVVSRIDNPEPGCPCCGLSPEQLLNNVDVGDTVVIADLEAGIGTLTRLGGYSLDVVLVVVEPTAKSIEIGARAHAIATSAGAGRVVVVANRVRGDEDVALIRGVFPDAEIVTVPDDPAVLTADRNGESPLDAATEGPAVTTLAGFAAQFA